MGDRERGQGVVEGKKRVMEKLIAIIKDLINKAFYGELVVKFEAGKVVLVRKTENIKP